MSNKRTIPLVAALLAALPLLAAAAQTDPQPHQHGTMMQPAEKAPMMAKCQAMMARHEEMQKRMAAMDAELDELVAAMRSATDEAKVEATAAVVEALVEQRKSMHAMMMRHQPMMMQHMMEHMGQGEGMAGCPMMQQMQKPSEPEPGSEHSEHHPD